MRVLLVDDDPTVLRFLEELLQARGHHVLGIQALAGEDGACLAAAASFRPHLLVVDRQMPLDPARVVAAVREAAPGARVILCTGTAPSLEEQRELGADDLLTKPFTPSDLDRMLERHAPAGEGT